VTAGDEAWAVVSNVVDPELRVVSIVELGIVRDVQVDSQRRVRITITPTYAGCPAMDTIRRDIRSELAAAGFPDVAVDTALAPAWTTDWISESGRSKLAAAQIAPPGPAVQIRFPGRAPWVGRPDGGVNRPVRLTLSVRCPRCGSPDTEELSRFGSTACKAIWRCRGCAEPFEQIKAL
jgi:ring-1,2-phenylacetyl-CoA epoxidase subunit PaaD